MEIGNFLKEIPVLETERLLLRRIALEDLDDLFEIFSNPEITHHMTWDVTKTKEETLNHFVKVVMDRHEKGQSVDWAIVHKESNKVIGNCAFIAWSEKHSRAEVGYVLNKQYWGRGYAAEALQGLIRFGFEVIGLNRIEGGCDRDNIGSENVMRKVGMKLEGILRKNEFIKGEFRDTKVFSILKKEYEKN
ncbi:GNAT family N-acetyltransferase [Niallia oryzisoli]|uniref:GNAT family N-acetyltransferase n=1 Tax=Niallia oryzisoli TaxID=1737571 RepID=UPI003734E0E0